MDPPGTSNWTMASIGEYGLDINNGDIANPIDAEDFMSYCGPRWISAFTYAYLTNIAGLSPLVIPTGSGAAARVITDEERNFERDETAIVPLIHILGSIDVDGKVEVVNVARLDTRYLRGFGRETGYMAQLLDADGRIIAQDHLYSYQAEGCESRPGEEPGCSECKEKQPILFKAMLNDVAPGSALRIVKRGKVVWERKGTDKPPAFGEVTAKVDKEGALKLTWGFDRESKEHTERPEVWVRWTNDDGRTWHALTVGQRGSSVTIEPAQLPSGYVRFQLLANDGFHTVTAMSEPVNLPAKPPAVTIQYPRASSRVYEERQIHLFGTASSYAGNAIDPEKASWYIDGDLVANGFDAWVESPGRGRHEVRLDVQEGEMKGSASEEIEVIPTKEEPPTPGA